MKNLTLSSKICLWLATLFGAGYVPLMPGTAGSILAVLIYCLVKTPLSFFIITIGVVIISFPISDYAEAIFGVKDCKKIVIDDFAGMLITFLFIPKDMGFLFILAGFFVFRMLDMIKIPPANLVEKYNGAKGIVGDDIVAGLYSNIILQFVRLLLKIFA